MMRLILSVCLLIAGSLAAPKTGAAVPRLDGKIVGGEAVDIADYPYQVSVQVLSSHICGGAIISERYIVTAAHCIVYPVSWYGVRAGSSLRNSGGQVASASSITVHPNYNSRELSNDIAIIYLSSALTLGSSVAVIDLPTQGQVIAAGTESVVSGWGTLSFQGSSPLQLQAVTVPIVELSSCASSYSVLGYGVTSDMICAGYPEGGKDACQGDSGGPLVANGQLIGVVSWGEECALASFPGVYASVPNLRSFINSVTGI